MSRTMFWRLTLGIISILILGGLLAALFIVEVPAVQGAIAGGLLGLISGIASSLGTLFVQRHLRKTGEIHCIVNAWTYANEDGAVGLGFGDKGVRRDFEVTFLNEREVPTALWNIKVVFFLNGTPWQSVTPRTTASQQPLDYLDLPSQSTVKRSLSVQFSEGQENWPDNIKNAKGSDSIKFVAEVPGDTPFERDLPIWDDPRISTPE